MRNRFRPVMFRMVLSSLVLLPMIFAFTLSSAALAAEPEQVAVRTGITGLDGLFFTTTGRTLKAGTLVLGGGFVFGSDDAYSSYTLPFTATYGATDRIEVALSLPVVNNLDVKGGGSESGIGDLDLRGKLSLQEETAALPAYGLLFHLKLAAADEDKRLGTGDSDVGIGFVADKDFGGVQTMLNVEYLLAGGDLIENQVNYALGFLIPYNDTAAFTIELLDQYLITSSNIGGDVLMGGMTVDLPPSMNLAFSLGLGLDDPSTDLIIGGKFNFNF